MFKTVLDQCTEIDLIYQ